MPSQKQIQIYDYLRAYIDRMGRPPTFDEIRIAKGLSTKSLVVYHLKALAAAGLIELTPNVARGIRVRHTAPQHITFSLPMRGYIRAGNTVASVELVDVDDVSEALELTRDLVPQVDGLYGLRVRGDSMRDALINDGDIVILQHQTVAKNGDMVAVRRTDRDEFTLKRFYRERGQVRLRPANPAYADIILPLGVVEVQGRVVAVIRQF